MTTGWGAAPAVAPRTAYEFTAAVAEGDQSLIAKLWLDLGAAERAQVLAALGAQARYTAHATGSAETVIAAQAIDLLADLRHCEARAAAMAALCGMPAGELPGCDGCPRPAIALARTRLRVLAALGFTPAHMAVLCRRAAGA